MEEVVICSLQLSFLVVEWVLGISVMLIVFHHIRVQRCFVLTMQMKMLGSCRKVMIIKYHIIGLAILTCYHMEEGKVPSSMAGSQDALLPILIGHQVNQTIAVTMKIMHDRIEVMVNGMMYLLKFKLTAAVRSPHL